jgi:hypothetical protein
MKDVTHERKKEGVKGCGKGSRGKFARAWARELCLDAYFSGTSLAPYPQRSMANMCVLRPKYSICFSNCSSCHKGGGREEREEVGVLRYGFLWCLRTYKFV